MDLFIIALSLYVHVSVFFLKYSFLIVYVFVYMHASRVPSETRRGGFPGSEIIGSCRLSDVSVNKLVLCK